MRIGYITTAALLILAISGIGCPGSFKVETCGSEKGCSKGYCDYLKGVCVTGGSQASDATSAQ